MEEILMKNGIWRFSIVFAALALHIQSAGAQEQLAKETAIHEAPCQFIPPGLIATRHDPPKPISLSISGAFLEGRNFYQLTAPSPAAIASADAESARAHSECPGPFRTGIVRPLGPVHLTLNDSPMARKQLFAGQHLWTAAIRSPGAFGLRLHFTDFDAADGAVLVYAKDGDQLFVRGPYKKKGPSRDGDFWTASLPGDTVFVEFAGTKKPCFDITELVHFDRTFSQPQPEEEIVNGLSCELDVMCYTDPPISSCARQASVQINFQKGGSFYVCSGTILADLDNETVVPYFLTAYHCLHTQTDVNTLEVVFFWQRTGGCTGTLPNYYTQPRITGGTLLETNDTDDGNDMTFIRLPGALPAGGCCAGWTTSGPDEGYGIHHPHGEYKRITFLSDVGFCPGCTFCGDPYDYDYYDMDDGIIEKGSSGSGVFNYNGQLAGQLLGDCCLYASCDGESLDCSNKDEFVATYGEFSTTYPIIRRWLELGGTIHVDGDYSGAVEEGTPSKPFRTVSAANNLAWEGVRTKIAAGSYPEAVTFSKAQTLLAEGGPVVIGQ